jgi:hypothetical protein
MVDSNQAIQKRAFPQDGEDNEQRKRQKPGKANPPEVLNGRIAGSHTCHIQRIKDVFASYSALSALLRRCLQVKGHNGDVSETVKEVAALHVRTLTDSLNHRGDEIEGLAHKNAGRRLALGLLPRYAAAFGHDASIKHAIDALVTLSLEDEGSGEVARTASEPMPAVDGIVKLLQALPQSALHHSDACTYAVASSLKSLNDTAETSSVSEGLWRTAETAMQLSPLVVLDWCLHTIIWGKQEQKQSSNSEKTLAGSAISLLERSVSQKWWSELINSIDKMIKDENQGNATIVSRLSMSIYRFSELTRSRDEVVSKDLEAALVSLKDRIAPSEGDERNNEVEIQPSRQNTSPPPPPPDIPMNDATLDLEEGELLEEGEVLEAPSKRKDIDDEEKEDAAMPEVSFVSTLVRISNFPSQVRERDVWSTVSRFGGRIFHPPVGSPLRRNDHSSLLASFRSIPDAAQCVEALDGEACNVIFPFLSRSSRENLGRAAHVRLLRAQFEPTPTALHLWCSNLREVLDSVPPHRSLTVRGKRLAGVVMSFSCLPDAQHAAQVLNEELSPRRMRVAPGVHMPLKYLWKGLVRKGRQTTGGAKVVCVPVEATGASSARQHPCHSDGNNLAAQEPHDWPEELGMHHRTDVGYVYNTLLPALDVDHRALLLLLPEPRYEGSDLKDQGEDQRQNLASLCQYLRQKHRAGVVDLGPLSDKHSIGRVAYLVPVSEEACKAFRVPWPLKIETLQDSSWDDGACLFVLVAPSLIRP